MKRTINHWSHSSQPSISTVFRQEFSDFAFGWIDLLYILQHIPGKDLHTANALSRAPLKSTENDKDLEQLAELLVAANISHLPAGKERLEQYQQAQKTDPTCSALRQYCRNGWPNKETLTSEIKPYWQERGNLTIGEDLLLHGSRVVVISLIAAADHPEASPGAPRSPVMSTESQFSSVVAEHLTPNQ